MLLWCGDGAAAGVAQEVAVMRLLADHPNAVTLHQVGGRGTAMRN